MDWEKCWREWQFYTLFYTLESKEEAQEGYMKSIGDKLGRLEREAWEISGIG